ncbi:hypothetical protein ABZ667_26510 [Streptomyces lavendulae]|uniref:hypothetical protein n=1 Tax=Streptomyces lavendulae TaxID=1914 RepID=UPI0033E757D1
MSAIDTTTTRAISIPTAAVLMTLTMRVEAMASTVWTSSATSVITRAASSSGSG